MTPTDRDDTKFIRSFTLCQERDAKLTVIGPIHLHRRDFDYDRPGRPPHLLGAP